MLGDIIRGTIVGITEAVRSGRQYAPQPQLAPANNYIFMPTQGPISPDVMLAPAVNGMYDYQDVVPSTLHLYFVASDEDDEYFTLDQPAVVMVFRLEDDEELSVGLRLENELDVDVAPGWYGVLTVVYLDEQLERVDGMGFTLVPVEDWAYDVDVAVELMEVDEIEAEEILEEIDEALSEVFV